jgi:hypothetical protein
MAAAANQTSSTQGRSTRGRKQQTGFTNSNLHQRVAFVAQAALEQAAIDDFFKKSWKWARQFVVPDGTCLAASISRALGITISKLLDGVSGFVNQRRNIEEKKAFERRIDLKSNDKKGMIFPPLPLFVLILQISFLCFLEDPCNSREIETSLELRILE